LQIKFPTFATKKSPKLQRSLQAPKLTLTLVVERKRLQGRTGGC
jgi:hypothetical protein